MTRGPSEIVLIADSKQFIAIRELRSSIAHEYDSDAMMTLCAHVLNTTPVLFDTIRRVMQYIQKYELVGESFSYFLMTQSVK